MTVNYNSEHFLNPTQANLFLLFKGPQGVLQAPPPLIISRTIKASQMKLRTVIVPLKTFHNMKRKFRNLTYDVIMTSLLKTMQKSDLREIRQIIYHSNLYCN